MTTIRRIDLPDADPGRAPVPNSSALVVAGDMAYVSGLRASDLRNARIPLPEMVEAQVEKIFSNLDLLLEHAGLSRERLVLARVHLVEFERLYPRLVQAWSRCIGDAHKPALTCVGVERLARGALVEIDFVLAI